jgi:ABC-type antimicrobial peptide transport system permease subunit
MAAIDNIKKETGAVIGIIFMVFMGGLMLSILSTSVTSFNESDPFYVDIAGQWTTIVGIIFVVVTIIVLTMAFKAFKGEDGNGGFGGIF